jgi:hypothetical protein
MIGGRAACRLSILQLKCQVQHTHCFRCFSCSLRAHRNSTSTDRRLLLIMSTSGFLPRFFRLRVHIPPGGLPAAGEEIFGAFRVHFHEFSSEIVSIFYNTLALYVAETQLLLIKNFIAKIIRNHLTGLPCRTVQIKSGKFVHKY